MMDDAGDRRAWRLRIYPIVVLATLLTSVVFAAVVFDEDDPESRLGGDFPAFYGAGKIAAAGDWDDLYSAERQQREQAGLIDDVGGYLYFSYPPFVAGAYAPLAELEYRWSFLVHTLVMLLALVGAVWLLWPWLRRLGWPPAALLVAALAFYPILRAVPGGQNTTLSLFLLAAATRLDHDERPMAAGVALALLLYKPQFGVVAVPLLLVARRWRVLGGWGLGAAGLYALSALPLGWDWAAEWWRQATSFRDLNTAANGANFVSLPGFFENTSASAVGPLLGYALAAGFGLGVAFFWWRHPHTAALERYALIGAAVVLAAPQTLFYDAGLLLLGVVAVSSIDTARAGTLAAGMIALSWLQPLAEGLGWSPLGPIAWTVSLAVLWFLLNASQVEPTLV
ncbi:MAG: glycosyltransferase family 87 protein [Acidimicrobiia bacterium]|nr:glycosyltransferase family 87 protein [Acidimicrobiia bacterium]